MSAPVPRPPLRLAPSILAAHFAWLGREAQALEQAGADWLHFDVMDNHYVPNLTVGPMVCAALRPLVRMPIDVHLMVQPVDALIDRFAESGANIITFHPEASLHVHRSLDLIRTHGCKAGLVLNPGTPVEVLDPVMDMLDVVLLMSVNPGFGGQRFIPSTLGKLHHARRKIDAHIQAGGQPILLEVDGGINEQTIAAAVTAGADVCVAGSAIFSAPDSDGGYATVIQHLRTRAGSALRNI